MSLATKQKKPLSLRDKQQAELFDVKPQKYPVDPNYFWITQKGESVHPTNMNTWHLFNSLRMIWNHTVPLEYTFMPYKPYHLRITKKRRAEGVRNLFMELMNRSNRTEQMNSVLRQMAAYVVGVKEKKLPSSIFYLQK